MYVAARDFNLTPQRRVLEGEPLPEVLGWSYPAIVANQNLGNIKWVEEAPKVTVETLPPQAPPAIEKPNLAKKGQKKATPNKKKK